jgi:hypothetical protein
MLSYDPSLFFMRNAAVPPIKVPITVNGSGTEVAARAEKLVMVNVARPNMLSVVSTMKPKVSPALTLKFNVPLAVALDPAAKVVTTPLLTHILHQYVTTDENSLKTYSSVPKTIHLSPFTIH